MQSFLNPKEILEKLKLTEEMKGIDLGSGSGGWAIPLAKILEEGRVYAVDVLEEPLSALKSKANLERITNIETIIADVEKRIKLPDETADIVLITNLLFQCYDKNGVIAEAKRLLKPKGKILIVDWIKDNPATGEIEKVSFEGIKYFIKSQGLKIEKEFPAGTYHLALILVK